MDAFKNFSKSTLAAGITSGVTSLTVATGQGARFPAAPFNAVIWNRTDFADPSDDPNVEIVRVTVVAGDVFTITRAQESTAASAHNTGGKTYGIIATLTAKTLVGLLANGVESNPVANVPILKGTLTSGTLIALRFAQTQDPLCGPVMLLLASGANPGPTSRRDTYMQFGFNPGGEADLMRFYEAIETFWNPGGTQYQIEQYYEHIDPNNGGGAVSFRPFSMVVRRDIQYIDIGFYASKWFVFDWPGHPGADHPFVYMNYPNLYLEDGDLSIDNNLRATVGQTRGISIGGYNALSMDRVNSFYYLGDSSQSITPQITCWGNFHIGGAAFAPATSRTLFLSTRSNAVTDVLWILNANAANYYMRFQTPDGTIHGGLSTAGEFMMGPGASGAGADVGLVREAAAYWKATDAAGGLGSIHVNKIKFGDGTEQSTASP